MVHEAPEFLFGFLPKAMLSSSVSWPSMLARLCGRSCYVSPSRSVHPRGLPSTDLPRSVGTVPDLTSTQAGLGSLLIRLVPAYFLVKRWRGVSHVHHCSARVTCHALADPGDATGGCHDARLRVAFCGVDSIGDPVAHDYGAQSLQQGLRPVSSLSTLNPLGYLLGPRLGTRCVGTLPRRDFQPLVEQRLVAHSTSTPTASSAHANATN